MASKGLQDLKQQVEGTAQEAVSAAGAAAQQVVDQATEAGQKGLVGLEGGGQPQHTSHCPAPPRPGAQAHPLLCRALCVQCPKQVPWETQARLNLRALVPGALPDLPSVLPFPSHGPAGQDHPGNHRQDC
ncbi:adipogenesis regulatory factor isoform X2 [Theropithecus gelada]|uniref:adipogenesis regulatory factor isoform X2 n=1 Tax=Theropithecus gelada TaxID=9565 RepID=UPI000DC16AE1|nr:adipogenesis regulatory factor isoform X2 [Theropithecus gelada]